MAELARTTTVTEYGVRFTAPCGSHVDEYGTDEAEARRIASVKKAAQDQVIQLVTRKVTTTVWSPDAPSLRGRRG